MKTSCKHAFLDNKAFNSLEKARFCEVVMSNGTCKGTNISVYNYISNILTLHYILYSINNLLISTVPLIILSVFFKKADFLLWLIFSHTEAFSNHFCNNIRNFEEILAKIRGNAKNAVFSEKNCFLQVLVMLRNYYFWFSKSLIFVYKIFSLNHLKFQSKSDFIKFSINLTFGSKSKQENSYE